MPNSGRHMAFLGLIFLALADATHSTTRGSRHYYRNKHTSVAAFLESIRGGSDWGGGDPGDSYYGDDYRKRPNAPSRYGDQEDRYGSSRPDDDSYYSERRPQQSSGYDEDRYYEYDDRPRRRSENGGYSVLDALPSKLKTGDRRIGFSLLGLGALVTMFGISSFFNKTLMRLGNLLFIAGVPITIGPSRTAGYFLQPQKIRATGCLAFGIFLVFIGRPIFGILLEIFGLLNLFGNMFPVVLAVAKQMPFVRSILNSNSGRGNEHDRERYDYGDDNRGYDRQYYDDQREDDKDPDRYY